LTAKPGGAISTSGTRARDGVADGAAGGVCGGDVSEAVMNGLSRAGWREVEADDRTY
jgi:hypothetical protein